MHFSILILTFCVTFATIRGKEIITSDLGSIHFYNQVKTLNFDISLENYFLYTKQYENLTEKIIYECANIPNEVQCNVYAENYNRTLIRMNQDIAYAQAEHTRVRRIAPALIMAGTLYAMGIVAVTVGTTIVITHAILEHDRQQQEEHRILMERNLNLTRDQMENDEQEQNDNEMLAVKLRQFNEMRDYASEILQRHDRLTEILRSIFNGRTKQNFFHIVGITDFATEIRQIQSELPNNYTLPCSNIIDLLNLSPLSFSKNDTHVTISVDIPLVFKSDLQLMEYIPIPLVRNKTVTILNMNSELYFREKNVIKIIPYDQYDKCMKIDRITVCNSMVLQSLETPSECMSSQLNGGNHRSCERKYIESKNYVMEISDNQFYCSIMEPMILRISCGDRNYIHSLNHSEILSYTEHCEVYEHGNTSLTSAKKDIKLDFTYATPNFTIYDVMLQNWTYNHTEINRRNIVALELTAESKILAERMHKLNAQPKKSIFGLFPNIMTNISDFFGSIKNTIYFVVVSIVLLIVVTCVCACCSCCIPLKRR